MAGIGRLLPALLAALALLQSGCTDAPRDAIRFALAVSPVTLDPRFATDGASVRVNRLLYARLVDFNARFEPVPDLARWERLGPTQFRFRLGEARREFSDGRRLVAADVKATYDAVLDPATGSPHRGSLAAVSHIVAVDADTVDFHLRAADALFPGRLVVDIMPADLLGAGHDFARRPVGSGDFAFVDWPEEGKLVLRRRQDGQMVEFLRVSEPTVRVLKLLRGEVDLLQGDLPPELSAWLATRRDVAVRTARGTNFAYLGFNLEDPVAGDVNLRRAIAHAIDREAIIRHVLGGAARPASAILPPDHWAGAPDLAPLGHDPPRAKALLEAAGYGPGRRPRLVYKTSSDPFRVRLATILQTQLAAAGIDVELRSYDWGTFYGDVKAGRFQMYSLAWLGIKMPDIFRYALHSASVPPAGANRGRFRDAESDRLIEAAERAPDEATQATLFRRLQAHLLERLPYVPLWYEDHVFVTRAGIAGYAVAPDGSYDGLATVHRVAPGGPLARVAAGH